MGTSGGRGTISTWASETLANYRSVIHLAHELGFFFQLSEFLFQILKSLKISDVVCGCQKPNIIGLNFAKAPV